MGDAFDMVEVDVVYGNPAVPSSDHLLCQYPDRSARFGRFNINPRNHDFTSDSCVQLYDAPDHPDFVFVQRFTCRRDTQFYVKRQFAR